MPSMSAIEYSSVWAGPLMVSAWPVWPTAKLALAPLPKVRVPPLSPLLVVSVSPPPPVTVMSALIAIEGWASSVSKVAAFQDSGAATVMSPVWDPPAPVETVTSAPPSAVGSVVASITESSPVAVKPVWLLSPPVEMVTL